MASVAKASGATNPKAVAGSIFWKKYGKKRGSQILRAVR